MDSPGCQPLAGAGFPGNQNRAVACSNPLDNLENLLDFVALSDYPVKFQLGRRTFSPGYCINFLEQFS